MSPWTVMCVALGVNKLKFSMFPEMFSTTGFGLSNCTGADAWSSDCHVVDPKDAGAMSDINKSGVDTFPVPINDPPSVVVRFSSPYREGYSVIALSILMPPESALIFNVGG